jgi:hypothetical protein
LDFLAVTWFEMRYVLLNPVKFLLDEASPLLLGHISSGRMKGEYVKGGESIREPFYPSL